MSKAVLVMDMPKSCGDCKLRKNGYCEPHSWNNIICGVYYNVKKIVSQTGVLCVPCRRKKNQTLLWITTLILELQKDGMLA